jgi:hypothetical protein
VSFPELDGWTLAGGTGLALQMGHRVSEDFDFFRTDGFSADRLHEALRQIGAVETLQEEDRTLTVNVASVKISFFSVPDDFLYPGNPYLFFQLADPRDIALMKLAAISGRGSRKDFIDLYSILHGGLSLEQCFQWLPLKYGEASTPITYSKASPTSTMPNASRCLKCSCPSTGTSAGTSSCVRRTQSFCRSDSAAALSLETRTACAIILISRLRPHRS